MSAYLITGSSGVGKTTMVAELKKRGYAAYDTDSMPEITRFYDSKTGQKVTGPLPTPIDNDRYPWLWDIPALTALFKPDQPVFIAGITSNTIDNLHLFDGIFILHPSPEALTHRLQTRTNNTYGKHPDELALILKHHRGSNDFWRSKGAIIIEADRPVTAVADEILAHVTNERATA